MPNIPNVPGVPPLSSYAANAVNLVVSATVANLIFGLTNLQWGLYLDGAPALDYNSTIDFEFTQDWIIADYPVEGGSFESYDKVQEPWDIKIKISSAGDPVSRAELITQLDVIGNSLSLYDFLTPEKFYQSCSVRHIDIRRTATNGVGMIIANIYLQQIRLSATTTYQDTYNPSNAGQQGTGNVQGVPDTGSVAKSVSSAGGPL